MRKSRAPSQQFPLVPKEDIGKSYFYIYFFLSIIMPLNVLILIVSYYYG